MTGGALVQPASDVRSRRTLADALADKEILVVVGSGGVGKTSVAAALALAAADEQDAIVLTIDPARRLASALGLEGGIGHGASRIEVPDARGQLHASMLHMQTAWDELVERHAPDREVAERIRTNRLYKGLSEHFVGSQGYMAMEALAEIHSRGEHDLVVIDTPPTRSALDFIEAPRRMTDFIGGSLLRWLAKPYTAAGKIGFKAFNMTASPFLKVADRVLGSHALEDISAFVMDFNTLYDDFKERAEEVLGLLADDRTGFVVVTTLEGPSLREAGFFIDRLVDEGLPLAGVIANKVIPLRFSDPEADEAAAALEGADPHAAAEAVGIDRDAAAATLDDAKRALRTLGELSSRDRQRLEELANRAKRPVAAVPLMTTDVHDLPSLRALAERIVSPQDG